MTITLRPIVPDEFDAFFRANNSAFGRLPSEEVLAIWRPTCDFTRSLAAFDGEQIVGTAGAFSFELTVPGPVALPAAGVTWVAVVPTHRRQGILRAMMRQQLLDVRQRGEPLAVLGASESSIYGRFGYGLATSVMSVEIERAHAQLTVTAQTAANAPGGRVRLVSHEEALIVLPPLYSQVRWKRAGMVTRDDVLWRFTLRFPLAHAGQGPRFYVVYENAAGEVEGAVYYRVTSHWEHELPRSVLVVEDMFTLTPQAQAALWRYCLGVDLIEMVRGERLPVDATLRWLLANPRRMRVTQMVDDLWLRLVDVPAALSGRGYAAAGWIVFEVADAFLPENSGRFALETELKETGSAVATCRRTESTPDLALEVADLGAAYLGGVRFRSLADAGRVRELVPGAIARADALFATARAPYCGTAF